MLMDPGEWGLLECQDFFWRWFYSVNWILLRAVHHKNYLMSEEISSEGSAGLRHEYFFEWPMKGWAQNKKLTNQATQKCWSAGVKHLGCAWPPWDIGRGNVGKADNGDERDLVVFFCSSLNPFVRLSVARVQCTIWLLYSSSGRIYVPYRSSL